MELVARFWATVTPPGDQKFKCHYPKMEGWTDCSTPENRSCWLRHSNGSEFNIWTDYERYAPIGVDRNYTLDIARGTINTDGMETHASLFNDTYPGPWIEACWGDRINIKVINNLAHNGTSIHWHGIRQLNSMHMDGVNGITQCPIAPGDSFLYSFNTTQYGSSWYHSHYSVQYADGLQGPLTIHGPSSMNFDEPKKPIILTDWGHNSAFQSVYTKQLKFPSILLNGHGNVTRVNNYIKAALEIPKPYELDFESVEEVPTALGKPKKYLLRIINTSFSSTFIFSIDNHYLNMASADFVPIEPYQNTSLLVGIGQRYNVIVEAQPETTGHDNPIPEDGNFWIRTWLAEGCSGGLKDSASPGYEKAGVLRYHKSSMAEPRSKPWPKVAKKCSDEDAKSLRPILKWNITHAANGGDGQRFRLESQTGDPFYPLAFFAFDMRGGSDFKPLKIDYSDPMFFHLNETKRTSWPEQWAVVPEDYKADDWVFLVLTGNNASKTFGAHPIHLHGHDFAIIEQVENATYPANHTLKFPIENPARRDVVLLPNGGYVIIAFKADNPGNWLLHCHIAYHASEGLAFQVLERQADANKIWPQGNSEALDEAERVCTNWKAWQSDCRNWWPGYVQESNSYPACHLFQDDSGI
ncbi:multicopper oxidase-domain-containing protein [Microdochium bolleyi]|uniref:Multicopper oxidase-domain-containing protein n=1 Tax=Microdochium bolleyi TaxID=196109 RepID=A0A136J3Z1_9PEZI|nr:multicopper oxidase-domain-containing protein [Microdochium bolleyi]